MNIVMQDIVMQVLSEAVVWLGLRFNFTTFFLILLRGLVVFFYLLISLMIRCSCADLNIE
jgi:hypothetical protein